MKNKNHLTVSLSGMDGAGKTTQLELLCSYLESNNISYRRIWCRPYNTPLFDLVRRIKHGKTTTVVTNAKNKNTTELNDSNCENNTCSSAKRAGWKDCLKLIITMLDIYIYIYSGCIA